ncbi:MAG: VWA domain-containing protein [Flavobacteriaceae bacterium]|nr:VWA domain-containing protein [Flavobacteriaceae bacterium]
MLTSTVAIIIIALLVAILIVYFQYFFREKKNRGINVLALLRFLSVFSIILLLGNPKIQKKITETIKPKLLVAVDNSSSISLTKQDSLVRLLTKSIQDNKELNEKFDVENFTFGLSLQNSITYTFKESQTNINNALSRINSIFNQQIAPIILISDGNQTYGNDYKFYQSKQAIYPIIIGDTTQIHDIQINQINVNSYSFLQNNFPVEVFVQYIGNENIKTNFIVEQANKVVYKEQVSFSENKNSVHLQFNLPANKVGKHLYKSKIIPFQNEKNTINNYKNFSVEVIDEQTKIAIVYDVLHPDISMLKRSIKSNQQRKVNLIHINNIEKDNSDIDLFILYQPNDKFKYIFNKINNLKNNYFIITGKQTDWKFLNEIQEVFKNKTLSTTQKYNANFNTDFDVFQIKDIGFSELPPLEGYFGELKFSKPYQSILTQSINGISTQNPLLATFRDGKNRGAVLFGENSWKWRALSYALEQSFQDFDQFLNNIIQYLTISKKTNPLDIDYNSFYYTDEPIRIIAKIYDSNFNFDMNASLKMTLEGSEKSMPFHLKEDSYELNLDNLESGNYKFTIVNQQNTKRTSGMFTVLDYVIEQEASQANVNDLQLLANNSKGKIFYPNQIENLFNTVLKNKNLTAIQKVKIKTVSLIDWKWLLGIIVVSLSLEWFIRKYKGLI